MKTVLTMVMGGWLSATILCPLSAEDKAGCMTIAKQIELNTTDIPWNSRRLQWCPAT